MNELLASLINIKKSYQEEMIDIDKFNIWVGECSIITGHNGSGKSTLLKIINGLVDADSGSIDYQNQSFLAKKRHPLAKKSIYLPSKAYLFDCSIESNIAYPLLLRAQFRYKDKIAQALSWANLSHLKNRHPATLSSGEIQRVALARAYIVNPPLWLLDEPIENLDKNAKQQFYELINKLLAQKRSIIIVTHSDEIARKIPSQIFYLENKALKEVVND